MTNIIKKWLRGQSAATAIEYGLIAAGVALVIAAAVFATGDGLSNFYDGLAAIFGGEG